MAPCQAAGVGLAPEGGQGCATRALVGGAGAGPWAGGSEEAAVDWAAVTRAQDRLSLDAGAEEECQGTERRRTSMGGCDESCVRGQNRCGCEWTEQCSLLMLRKFCLSSNSHLGPSVCWRGLGLRRVLRGKSFLNITAHRLCSSPGSLAGRGYALCAMLAPARVAGRLRNVANPAVWLGVPARLVHSQILDRQT